MAKRITPGEMRAWLEEYLRQRRNIGFWKAVANIAFCPPDPFKPKVRRRLRPGFLFAAGMVASAACWFFYFNFMR